MLTIHPAATVLTIREHPMDGIQVLLLKRNDKLKFAPGFWVFPGGRIDFSDGPMDEESLKRTAKIAAAREAFEEAGIRISPKKLNHYCHWTTPAGGNRRFSTWFFHGQINSDHEDVVVDQSEIVNHRWMHPSDALKEMQYGALPLLPPTFISLHRIKKATSYREVTKEFDRTGVISAAPVTIVSNGIFYCLYEGDSGYDTNDINQNASLHRLIINQNNGHYRFEHTNCSTPPVSGGVSLHH